MRGSSAPLEWSVRRLAGAWGTGFFTGRGGDYGREGKIPVNAMQKFTTR
jgi:hypothetical protein